MQGRVDKHELAQRIAARLGYEEAIVEEFIDAFSQEIYQALKQGNRVSLHNFGTFYVRPESTSWVFKFNPSQRWRALFGWSSTYKGNP